MNVLERYNRENFYRFVRNPKLGLYEVVRIINECHRRVNIRRNPSGTDVMSEDWDNLILLDACRYDAFSKVNTLKGNLEERVSKGSTSKEFIKSNFVGRELHDTVYITANPYV